MVNISKSQLAIRALQFIWILLITALIGNVLAGKVGTSSSVNYAMFTAAFCWIVWLFGIAAVFYSGLAIPIVLFVMDILAAVFTFVAAVVLAAKLGGGHSCNNEVSSASTSAPPLTSFTELHAQQLDHPRRRLANQALPRAAGVVRLLLVPVGLFHGLAHHHGDAGLQERRWHGQSQTS